MIHYYASGHYRVYKCDSGWKVERDDRKTLYYDRFEDAVEDAKQMSQLEDYEQTIRNLEPDFDVTEEQIIEHYRLKYEGLEVRQLDWWLAELSRLESKLPMGSQYVKMTASQNEAHKRAKESL